MSTLAPTQTPESRVQTARILVVDDDPVNRIVMVHLLRQRGYSAEDVSSGEEALPRLLHEDFDLVMLDLSMPGLSGLQTARLVRQAKSQLQLPIVMLTSNEERNVVLDAFQAGVNDYVTKPIDAEIVHARIELQLQLKTAQSSLARSEERYALAAAGSNDGLWDWNLAEDRFYCSDRMKSMLGQGCDSLKTVRQLFDLVHDEDSKRVRNDLKAHLRGESQHFETELRMLHKEEGYRWMLSRGMAVRDGDGKAVRFAGSLTDITAGKVADALTGLPNRLLFVDRVQRCLDQYRRNPCRQLAVLYLDLDSFKLINDTYGHDVGDEFLIEIARRLESAVRSCDSVVSRLGGDEFAILVENLVRPEGAVAVATRINDAFAAPVQVAGRELFSRPSIGISIDTQCERAEEMIREADVAMYFAKKNKHLPYKIFANEMMAETVARLEMRSELRTALSRNEMHLNYQPIIRVATGKTAGFEALLRWNSENLGSVPPGTFIPLAEDTGAIVELGEYVIRQSCKFAAQANRTAGHEFLMSVNISTRQILADSLLTIVGDSLASNDLRGSCLKLEVTETAVMQDAEKCIDLLGDLQRIGVAIGLDDFGTGYSSLAYLHRLPLNMLKIDRSFVQNMFDSSENLAIIETIMTLAQSLGLEVIAEGVETEEQLKHLESIGCHFVQGFYFSTPVQESAALKLIHKEW